MITTLFSLVSLAAATAPSEVQFSWKAPEVFLPGEPFTVTLVAESKEGGELEAWMLTPAALTASGKALADRPAGKLTLYSSGRMEVSFDLAPQLASVGGAFELAYEPAQGKQQVQAFERAPQETKFLDMPTEQLGAYRAVLQTNRGTMVAEFWPDVAPNHVKNFLDLCHTGFYDGVLFHRVIPGFMIQGGDPLTKNPADQDRWGTGRGPRQIEAEFNNKKHVRGVLSMARTADPNSATSQFFVCHDTAPHLDRQYSGFGQLISGFEALDMIVNTPRGPADRPNEPQRIERAFVVRTISAK